MTASLPECLSFTRFLACRVFFDYFQGAAQALFGAARQQQRSNRVDRHALAANDFADILRMQPQLINRRPFPLHRRHRDSVRVLDQAFDDVFEKRLHFQIRLCRDSGLRRSRRGFGCFLDKTSDRVTRLGSFAQPIPGPIQIQLEIVAFFQWLIRSYFLDELAIPRTATIRYNNAEYRGVLGPDALHANFNCHN